MPVLWQQTVTFDLYLPQRHYSNLPKPCALDWLLPMPTVNFDPWWMFLWTLNSIRAWNTLHFYPPSMHPSVSFPWELSMGPQVQSHLNAMYSLLQEASPIPHKRTQVGLDRRDLYQYTYYPSSSNLTTVEISRWGQALMELRVHRIIHHESKFIVGIGRSQSREQGFGRLE